MNGQRSSDAIARLGAADPVDERVLADRVGALTDEVIAELTAGARLAPVDSGPEQRSTDLDTVTTLPRRRRLPWTLVAAACAAAVAVTATLVGQLAGTSKPAYAITVDHGVVVVNWVRDLRDGSEIADDLRAYGVDASVRAVPASPSQVGRVLTVAVNGIATGEMPPGVSRGADGTDEVFTWRIDPSRFTESIQIEIGVEPDAGEQYVVAESAFAPGEVLGGLHCALENPSPPRRSTSSSGDSTSTSAGSG